MITLKALEGLVTNASHFRGIILNKNRNEVETDIFDIMTRKKKAELLTQTEVVIKMKEKLINGKKAWLLSSVTSYKYLYTMY